ncbi:MAG: Re/Si-specific NAD(P)(+) transhydrogenase subunit alpha [Bacteroidales bacterium]|nr:Re/Si-specific NAD(P)(+) transhydrogenase subunit alpha [Bacteroidales bacterium]
MIIGVLKENKPEKRVALTPDNIAALVKKGAQVIVETDCGSEAYFSNEQYAKSGAKVEDRNQVLDKAQLLVFINPLDDDEIGKMASEKVLVGALNPFANKELVADLCEKKITSFSMELVPRTTRAQSMDILSSMATIAGYKAVLDAARMLPKFFPMFMSAAGTIKPAKVLILGAGVAGLQAIAIARKLGAVVEVFDVRSAVKEEVMSLGGKFIEVEGATEDKSAGGYAVEQTEEFKQRQSQLIQEHAISSDVVICTAQIPGKTAPVLVLKETVEQMKPGSVIVDLAASTGGNCELTEDGAIVEKHRVTIIGQSAYPSETAIDASSMFGRNLVNFISLMIGEEGALNLNFEDDIVKGTCLTHEGEIINERIKSTN